MKNIHVLPTDKPSRLIMYSKLLGTFRLLDEPCDDWKGRLNIYITSDEEIKEGDWCIDKHNVVYKQETDKIFTEFTVSKKIILTTDQDLIKDDVQAIDDTFLEWFVKNPSCGEVKVNPYCEKLTCQNNECKICCQELKYKIIIPKEEPKQLVECKCSNALQAENCNRNCGHGEEPKQETLEEASERIFTPRYTNYKVRRQGFIEGSKWCQERSYSKEEVDKLLYRLLENNMCSHSGDELIEQFKKSKQ